jgi:transcriptional regulator with XRE-family HTH domain
MFCPKCKAEMGKTQADHQYRECGLDNIWLKNWETYVCPQCKTRLPVLPDPRILNGLIAHGIVTQEARLDGDAIHFLRKALELTSEELAHVLGVHRVEVSRWENNRVQIDPYQDFKLRLEAVDRIIPASKKRRAREAVTMILQRDYKKDLAATETNIPVSREDLVPA